MPVSGVARWDSGQRHWDGPGPILNTMTAQASAASSTAPRLTTYAHGGGCACKIPPGELEGVLAALPDQVYDDVLVGVDGGDDAAAVRLNDHLAVLSTADFFTPVVDDAYDWGRIAAANALSDIYAMGGTPTMAINLVGWPREILTLELLTEVLRGGLAVAQQAGCPLIGGHTVDDPEPKYGLAVTGTVPSEKLLRNDAAAPGLPLTLTKPIGLGLLNNRHKATGEVFAEAVETMVTLNREAAQSAVQAGVRAATDVTGFGLLGHLFKMCRASGVGARIDASAVPLIDGAQEALREGYISGGTRRNLDWVREHLIAGPGISEEHLLTLADAQTSGGLLVVGEIPGYPIIGHTTEAAAGLIEIR
jgi:selenide, water dikinase